MKYILETERLRLKEFTLEDAAFILQLLNSPGWLKYIGDKQVRTEEQARNYLQQGPIKSYSENGFGLAMVETKTDQNPIGICGLLKRTSLPNPDIGFAFLPLYWGQGLALESTSFQ